MSAAACIERTDLTEVLRRTAFLSTQTPQEIQSLAARTVRRVFGAGELLFSEGEPCHGLHMIARGRVRVFKTSLGGREQVLAMNGAGESLAELPVFDGGPYAVSALAVEETEVAFISREDFQRFCMAHPEVALKMVAVVGARLRRMMGIIEELSFTTIRERLVSVLVKLTETEGRQTVRGVEFVLPASHQEMASQLGTVRELVSRNLMRLQAEGLVEVYAREIVVRDLNGLTKIIGWPSTWGKESEKQSTPSDLSLKFGGKQKTIEMRQASPRDNIILNNGPEMLQRAQRAAKSRQLPLQESA
jgi:CRP/FNR family cyclic AMP-dependent transcriptional regulator